ncbi:uncharacterized protein LOC142777337 isoform X2 [Rhipicephalus microplus]|uniref:uncharacterized protein LOC142777337 isoform X2 n=1 Tax=Rhipicephalus microplus TaxID=6941 RepID=UPI003F6C998B
MDDAKSDPVLWPCISSSSDWQPILGFTAQVVSSREQMHGTTSLNPALKDLPQRFFTSGHGETGGIMSLMNSFLYATQITNAFKMTGPLSRPPMMAVFKKIGLLWRPKMKCHQLTSLSSLPILFVCMWELYKTPACR